MKGCKKKKNKIIYDVQVKEVLALIHEYYSRVKNLINELDVTGKRIQRLINPAISVRNLEKRALWVSINVRVPL